MRTIFKHLHLRTATASQKRLHYAIAVMVGTPLLVLLLLQLLTPPSLHSYAGQQPDGTEGELLVQHTDPAGERSAITGTPASPAVPITARRATGTAHDAAVEQQLFVQIDGRRLTLEDLSEMTALDHVMQDLLGQPAPLDQRIAFERLLNTTIVEQAADRAGFHLTTDEYVQALDQWLMAHQQTESALQIALAAQGFTLDVFAAYFRRLLTVDRFLAKEGNRQGQSPEVLMRRWQQQARVSFGPAAQTYFAAQQAALPQAETALSPTEGNSVTTAPTGAAQPLTTPPFSPFAGLQAQELWQSMDEQVASDSVTSTLPTTVASATVTPPAAAPTESPLAPVGLAPGNRAPAFTLPLLDDSLPGGEGAQMNLSAWQGKPIVLSFWTTWCPYCRKQTPVLVAGAQLTTAQHVQFIGINVNEIPTTVQEYVETHQIPYPILLDTDGTVASGYAVRGYPTTYFIDAGGHIMTKHVGVLDETALAQYVAQFNP